MGLNIVAVLSFRDLSTEKQNWQKKNGKKLENESFSVSGSGPVNSLGHTAKLHMQTRKSSHA